MSDLTLPDVREALTEFFSDGSAFAEVRSFADAAGAAFDRERWRALSLDLGLGALVVDDANGGLGLDARFACAAIELSGAALCPAPVTSTLTAAAALVLAGVPDTAPWLRAIAENASIATVAVRPDGRTAGVAHVAEKADHYLVTAEIPIVADADSADFVVLAADSDRGIRVVGIDLRSGSETARTEGLVGTDFARGYSSLTLRDHPGIDLGDGALWQQIEDQALVFAAADRLGCARGALRMAVDYAGQREQFGRIIGTYQAISHRLAEAAVDVEGAAGLVDMAARAMANRSDRLPALAPLAAATTARVALAAADTLIQVHGGIGFTWEHNAQFYFRRARTSAQWMGSPGLLEDRAGKRNCHRLLTA